VSAEVKAVAFDEPEVFDLEFVFDVEADEEEPENCDVCVP
jgi:hypothetical protein